jgi:hypothetical protein
MTFKSVHIKECWPFEYAKVVPWHTRSQASKDKRNAAKRAERLAARMKKHESQSSI